MTNTRSSQLIVLGATLVGLASATVMAQATGAKETTTKAKPATKSALPPSCPAILNHVFPRLQDDAPQNLCQYAGKVLLVVNTASFCGYTKQYEGLEALFARYHGEGLVVLGFPSNEFGDQEPGSSKEIADFCFNTYGVKFPMFSKSTVTGKNRNALYGELFKATHHEPQWNFHKFLVDRNGKVTANYASKVEPDNTELVASIRKALAAKH